jgi:hypothetical protein
MGTSYQQRSVQPPVGEILYTASLELRELRACLLQLTRRIQTLKRALAALRDFESDCLAQPRRAFASSPDEHPELALESDPALRRACRIALLESCEGLSEDEILARITRRGSYSFLDQNFAKIAIANELREMSKACEAQRVRCASGAKWRRL